MQQLRIRYEQDLYPVSPLEWSEVSFWIPRGSYSHMCTQEVKHITDVVEFQLWAVRENADIWPLYVYSHSGEAFSTTPFGIPWDSGQTGFVYMTKKQREDVGCTDDPGPTNPQAYVNDVLKTYNEYLLGNVWGYVIEDETGEHIESCGGYYGSVESSGCKEDAEQACEYIRTQPGVISTTSFAQAPRCISAQCDGGVNYLHKEVTGRVFKIPCDCGKCGKQWKAVYQLIGYEEVKHEE